jgi:hypothetical protein
VNSFAPIDLYLKYMSINASEMLKIAKNGFEKYCDIMVESRNCGARKGGHCWTTADKL